MGDVFKRTNCAEKETTVHENSADLEEPQGQAPGRPGQPPPQQGKPSQQGQPPQRGMARYEQSAGLVSFSYPDSWRLLQPPIQLGITFRVYDPSTSMGLDVVEVPNAKRLSAEPSPVLAAGFP